LGVTLSREATRTEILAQWVADLTGCTEVALTRLPGGGRHEAWSATAAGGGEWFLRADAGLPGGNEHYTLRREADFYRAAHQTGIPCPAVLGVHPDLEAVLLEHRAGDAAFARLDEVSQNSIVDDLAPILARMHAADPTPLKLGPVKSIAEHTVEELDIWQRRLDGGQDSHPFLTACFSWLRANNPNVAGQPSLVQGDTGPGNLLHDGAKVTAVLDFELAHIGDPMTDLSWVATRNAQEPVPDFDRFLAGYEAASGATPDPSRLRFHALFAELRIACLGADRVAEGGGLMNDLGAQIIYSALHFRLTVEALAAATGNPMPETELPTANDTSQTRYYDGALLQMREIISPEVSDPFASRRLKNMARIFKYLREADRVGAAHDELECDDAEELLGARPPTVAAARSALDELVRSGELNAVDLLPYAAGRSARMHQLAGPAMGALATRHLPNFG
jgi:aminoglycoside phosphotransferase (APT) family kinase protein